MKLTEQDIKEIKRLIDVRDFHLKQAGVLSAPKIGERFGISRHTVNRISTGEYRNDD